MLSEFPNIFRFANHSFLSYPRDLSEGPILGTYSNITLSKVVS